MDDLVTGLSGSFNLLPLCLSTKCSKALGLEVAALPVTTDCKAGMDIPGKTILAGQSGAESFRVLNSLKPIGRSDPVNRIAQHHNWNDMHAIQKRQRPFQGMRRKSGSVGIAFDPGRDLGGVGGTVTFEFSTHPTIRKVLFQDLVD
ncbi:hypothetical protein Z945_839 [Sulfitobacter noctilucae]|nr:hypothetical protein Z945_839 [Sulfitobacter noctilucae]